MYIVEFKLYPSIAAKIRLHLLLQKRGLKNLLL